MKYAKRRAFRSPHFPVYGQNGIRTFLYGFTLTVRADYVSFTCQTLGFRNIYLLVICIYNHPSLAS